MSHSSQIPVLRQHSHHGNDVRIGPVSSLPDVLEALGVSPRRVFTRAGVKPGIFRNQENRIPFESLGRLFAESAALTGCQHVGLLVGERFDLAKLGLLGDLMRHSPTIGVALQELMLYLHLHDRGAVPLLLRFEPSSVLLGYSIYRSGIPAAAQLYDTSIAIGYCLLTELCGPDWRPLHVQFSHAKPKSVHPYRRLFGPNVGFDAEVTGVAFDASWLDQPIRGADAEIHRVMLDTMRKSRKDATWNFTEEVKGVLHQAILGGSSSARSVAALFGIHERTLRKRLSAEGNGLRELICQTRAELAKQLLQNTRLPVTRIAASLNYSDPNIFSRAFRGWEGASPREWRTRHQSPAAPVSASGLQIDPD